jgi:hypothetical protein
MDVVYCLVTAQNTVLVNEALRPGDKELTLSVLILKPVVCVDWNT